MQLSTKRVLVVGATGGSGRATLDALLKAGHEVTAFSRHADRLPARSRLRRVCGDATNRQDVEAAVRGQDAVIVTLGISESALRVRLLGSKGTPMAVRSAGTRTVIEAMEREGIQRLVVLSSFGVGETRRKLRLVDRIVFALLFKPQIRDTEKQEQVVRRSTLEWVIAQPVHLTDEQETESPFLSAEGAARRFKVARGQVAGFLAASVGSSKYLGRSVAVSG